MTDQHPHPFSPRLRILKIAADPDVAPEWTEIDDNLQSVRDAIGGGYIEIVRNGDYRMQCGCKVVMVVDEEGLLKEQPLNERAIPFYSMRPIVGDVFFVAEGYIQNADGEEDLDFVSLAPEWETWGGPGHWPLPTVE